MTSRQLIALTAVTLAASISSGYAGPCSLEIDRMQARVDAKLAAKPGTGPTAPESPGALLHRQPTPGSIAEAEEKLGEVSPRTAGMVAQALARARAADGAGDKGACEQALADVQRAIGP